MKKKQQLRINVQKLYNKFRRIAQYQVLEIHGLLFQMYLTLLSKSGALSKPRA